MWTLLVAGLAFYWVALAIAVELYGRRDCAAPADVIVVLGAKVLAGGVPSGSLRARTQHAVALFHRGLAPRLLLTGGVGAHPPAEALLERDLAVAAGAPPEACLLETDSLTTFENATFAARALAPLGFTRVILVSDPFHLLRASRFFLRAGLEPLPSPAALAGRGFTFFDRLRWTFREAGAIGLQPWLLLFPNPRERSLR
jgi:uncharacterized SAM-binding protein YcdF (DUF218 family)